MVNRLIMYMSTGKRPKRANYINERRRDRIKRSIYVDEHGTEAIKANYV